MGRRFHATDSTISPIIEIHRRARSRRAALEQREWLGWSLLRSTMLILLRWRERRALSRLIAVVPSTEEEARCKLMYMMAIMIADQAPDNLDEVATVVDTLRPYQDSLICYLRK